MSNSDRSCVHFNAPSVENGFKFENVRLTFKDGKIIDATANNTEKLNAILDTDEGARYVGEFALGVNPYIVKPMVRIIKLVSQPSSSKKKSLKLDAYAAE